LIKLRYFKLIQQSRRVLNYQSWIFAAMCVWKWLIVHLVYSQRFVATFSMRLVWISGFKGITYFYQITFGHSFVLWNLWYVVSHITLYENLNLQYAALVINIPFDPHLLLHCWICIRKKLLTDSNHIADYECCMQSIS